MGCGFIFAMSALAVLVFFALSWIGLSGGWAFMLALAFYLGVVLFVGAASIAADSTRSNSR